MKLNDWTFLIGIFFLPIWLVWETVVLKMRGGGIDVDTISMVMKARGYQMNALPFFWASMMTHWWFNWFHTPVWSSPIPAVTFWLLQAATLGLDIYLWNTPYSELAQPLKFYRAPMVQCVVGMAAAYFLFPQKMTNLPGWRWW